MASLLLAVSLTACGVPVDIGLLDEGGTTGVDSGGTASASEPSETATATSTSTSMPTSATSTQTSDSGTSDTGVAERRDFSIRMGDIPDVGTDTGTSVGTSVGSGADSATSGEGTAGDPDADALLVVSTTGAPSCDDPFAALQCGGLWSYSFVLPPSLQFVGASGDLVDIGGSFTESAEEPFDCGFGGGTLSGRFEITAFDDTHVAGRLFELDAMVAIPELFFDAPRCVS